MLSGTIRLVGGRECPVWQKPDRALSATVARLPTSNANEFRVFTACLQFCRTVRAGNQSLLPLERLVR